MGEGKGELVPIIEVQLPCLAFDVGSTFGSKLRSCNTFHNSSLVESWQDEVALARIPLYRTCCCCAWQRWQVQKLPKADGVEDHNQMGVSYHNQMGLSYQDRHEVRILIRQNLSNFCDIC